MNQNLKKSERQEAFSDFSLILKMTEKWLKCAVQLKGKRLGEKLKEDIFLTFLKNTDEVPDMEIVDVIVNWRVMVKIRLQIKGQAAPSYIDLGLGFPADFNPMTGTGDYVSPIYNAVSSFALYEIDSNWSRRVVFYIKQTKTGEYFLNGTFEGGDKEEEEES